MVIDDSHTFITMVDQYDPNNKEQLENINNILINYPNFQFLRVLYLKAIKYQNTEAFDKTLSHTSVSTYDRELLYRFLETKITSKKIIDKKVNIKNDELVIKNQIPKIDNLNYEKTKKTESEKMEYSKWISFLSNKKTFHKKKEIDNKFELINKFLENENKIIPNKDNNDIDDLSEKSLVFSDELMTETLAKVFTKQKKYSKALEAYQILILKYPEKNSFFADQIKKIKKLQKLKD